MTTTTKPTALAWLEEDSKDPGSPSAGVPRSLFPAVGLYVAAARPFATTQQRRDLVASILRGEEPDFPVPVMRCGVGVKDLTARGRLAVINGEEPHMQPKRIQDKKVTKKTAIELLAEANEPPANNKDGSK
jgi:hypothetical protein